MAVILRNGAKLQSGVYASDVVVENAGSSPFNAIDIVEPYELIISASGTYVFNDSTIYKAVAIDGAQAAIILNNSTITSTDGDVEIENPMSIIFQGHQVGDFIRIQNGAGAEEFYVETVSSPRVFSVPKERDGELWRYSVDRVGFAPQVGNIAIAEGTVRSIDVNLTEYKRGDGVAQYTGTTTPNIAVEFDFVAPQMSLLINGQVSPQQLHDVSEQALVTADGMKWHADIESVVLHDFETSGGRVVRLGDFIRLARQIGASDASVSGFAVSTQGLVVDNSNGPVSYVGGAIAEAVYVDGEALTNGDGSQSLPFDNADDAKNLAESLGIKTILIAGDITLQSSLKNFIVDAWSSVSTIDFNGQQVDRSRFSGLSLKNALTEPNNPRGFTASNCTLENVGGLRGTYRDCLIFGTVGSAQGAKVDIINGSSGMAALQRPTFDFAGGAGASVTINGYLGGLDVINSTDLANEMTISGYGVSARLTNTVTEGTFQMRTLHEITDESGPNALVNINPIDVDTLSEQDKADIKNLVYDETTDDESLRQILKYLRANAVGNIIPTSATTYDIMAPDGTTVLVQGVVTGSDADKVLEVGRDITTNA